MFRFDWDSERKKAPCVWSMGGMRFVELNMESVGTRRRRKREDVGTGTIHALRRWERDLWGIASGIFLFFFFFNYTPRDVQKNYHQGFSGYECIAYRIYESKLSLRIELLSYIFSYPRQDENRSILLIYLSKHLMTVWMIKQQETILFVTGKKY